MTATFPVRAYRINGLSPLTLLGTNVTWPSMFKHVSCIVKWLLRHTVLSRPSSLISYRFRIYCVQFLCTNLYALLFYEYLGLFVTPLFRRHCARYYLTSCQTCTVHLWTTTWVFLSAPFPECRYWGIAAARADTWWRKHPVLSTVTFPLPLFDQRRCSTWPAEAFVQELAGHWKLRRVLAGRNSPSLTYLVVSCRVVSCSMCGIQ
jgi:hypothetical protein